MVIITFVSSSVFGSTIFDKSAMMTTKNISRSLNIKTTSRYIFAPFHYAKTLEETKPRTITVITTLVSSSVFGSTIFDKSAMMTTKNVSRSLNIKTTSRYIFAPFHYAKTLEETKPRTITVITTLVSSSVFGSKISINLQ
jgi:hypothetical protein